MGGFYGSVQVRSENLEQVRQAAEQVAKAKGIKCLLGPVLSGWVGVYPENNGQDQTFGEEIACRVDCDVLHILVHDDDVMAYWLWRGGQLADSFWSRPGYFGEEQREAQEALAGQPDVFSHLLPDGIEPMRQMLRRDREDFPFEVERLEQFGRLLGIANAATAYEYLKAGETEGIRGWKQFDELPADEIDKENQAAKEKRKQLNAQKKQLKSSGLLLAEVTVKDGGYRACRAERGFAAIRSSFIPGGATPLLEYYDHPWKAPAVVPLDLTPQVNGMTSDSEGRRVAAAIGRRCVVWDTRDWRVLREVPEEDWAIDVALNADGRLVAHSSRDETVITDVDSGLQTTVLQGGESHRMAFHPAGRYFAAIVDSGRVEVVDLHRHNTGQWRKHCLGGSRIIAHPWIVQRLESADPDETAREQYAAMESALEKALRSAESSGQRMSEEKLREIQDRAEKIFEKVASDFHAIRSGTVPTRRTPNEFATTLEFTSDGQWLCCGTSKGFRVYSWAAVLEANDDEMPEPEWLYDVDQDDDLGRPDEPTYAIVQEVGGSGFLFGGLGGQLFRMDMELGEVRCLLTMPEQASMLDLVMSRDGQALGIITRPSLRDRGRSARNDRRSTWSIWSYPELLAAAKH